MDRRAIATEQRRRHVLDRLEDEQRREEALTARLESVIDELEGPGIDEAVLAVLGEADAALVREAIGLVEEDLGVEGFFDGLSDFEAEIAAESGDPAAETEAEIERLQGQIAASRATQAALNAYLTALERLGS